MEEINVEEVAQELGLEEVDEEEVRAQIAEALGDFDVQDFLTDVMLFDYLVKNNGVVIITEEDMQKIEEIRRTRAIEFMSELDEETGKRVMIARLLYEGEENEDEEVSDDN
jgi:hypothetical protein